VLIPSFWKLDKELQKTILSSLEAEFNFGQFLQTEALPHSLRVVKDLIGAGGEDSNVLLYFFLFRIFAQMSGLFGFRSLNASLFMTDRMYVNYSLGLEVLQGFAAGQQPLAVYERFLAERATAQGLALQDKDARAQIRLACLTRIYDIKGGKEIKEAFDALNRTERINLANFLNADGIAQVPGFIPYNAPNYLEASRLNPVVGLGRATRLLLKVFEEATVEYADSEKPVLTIFFDNLTSYTKECKDSEVFDFTKFHIARTAGQKNDNQGSISMSPWQLVKNQAVLDKLEEEGDSLVRDTMSQLLRETQFIKRLPQVFPELKFFGSDSDPRVKAANTQTLGTLLATYWVATDHAEAFTRGQATERKLSSKSWRSIIEMGDSGGSGQAEKILHCVYVASTVLALGKIPKFKEQLAPHCKCHQEVLAYVMDTCPRVLPSYFVLEGKYLDLVRQCATQPLSIEQLTTTEALPGNLTSMKNMLQKASDKELYLQVFCRVAFAELAGSRGTESLEGSTYMTEDRFVTFTMAIEALRLFIDKGGGSAMDERAVYERHLQERAKLLEFPMEQPLQQIVMRLACLAEVSLTLEVMSFTIASRNFQMKNVRSSLDSSRWMVFPRIELHSS
jgi:hypothetical protein